MRAIAIVPKRKASERFIGSVPFRIRRFDNGSGGGIRLSREAPGSAALRSASTLCLVNYPSNDAQLFYTTAGNGPDVVLLHPTPCDHRFWLRVVESLSGRYRVILPDLRGHGQSEAGSGPITIEKLGADIVKLLDGLGIQRALFGGCSVGGYTLYELWREVPARVSALAFCCSRPQADAEANRAKREEWIAQIRQRGTGEFIEAMVESLIGPTARQRSPERIRGDSRDDAGDEG